jgi:hypothetical protein
MAFDLEIPPFTDEQSQVVRSSMSSLELLELINDHLPERTVTYDYNLDSQHRVEYAEAALLCLRDRQQELVEQYFMGTGLIRTGDIRDILGRMALKQKQEERAESLLQPW